MTPEEMDKRLRRAQEEQFVIMKVDEGVRIYAAQAPHRPYIVAGTAEAPTCTCLDFTTHQEDASWSCKHIFAVKLWGNGGKPGPSPQPTRPRPQEVADGPRLVVKRSISPDGRIDSLSVEISAPISGVSRDLVASQAAQAIRLSSGIVDGFLRDSNGNGAKYDSVDEHQIATIENVDGMDTRWGRRLFLNIRVNGQIRKYFGSDQQLARTLATVGFSGSADQVREGLTVNLPCRVMVKPTEDGRYVNVVKILSASPMPARV